MRNTLLKQTAFLIAVTVVYLIFELGFNGRLLDVVGGAATPDDVHHIEYFGRTLSGIAAALVVLQLMLTRRAKGGQGKPSYRSIVIACAVTIVVVFLAIKTLVDVLVNTRDAQFRRTAANTVLMQRSLVDGRLQLDGLGVDDGVFARPEGKAFLALFPVMAVSVDRLDEKTRTVKTTLVRDKVRREMGGVQSYYDKYTDGMKRLRKDWNKYAAVISDGDPDLLQEQQKAWNDYRARLSRRGWQPETVPFYARGKVSASVRRDLPALPSNWRPDDMLNFYRAVGVKYRQQAARRVQSVEVGGETIPPGLSYEAFVARRGVQNKLREEMHLPASAVVQASYTSAASFEQLFDQAVDEETRKMMVQLDAPASDYADGGKWAKEGLDATRAAIVPAVALFFSLLGAIGHFSKLLFLSAKGVMLSRAGADGQLSKRASRATLAVLFSGLIGVWAVFSFSSNAITRSDLFHQMMAWSSGGTTAGHLLTNIAHVVVVGQGYGYPLNEAIRQDVLMGFKYGYDPLANAAKPSK
ncbi:hypothetical protein PPN31114_01682 [Pandoraea pneumonica]|uniref:Uncharacterized protein n=1 Tax=Pandoraea pneumonica TaxID=2508299 RepID=A0A5E4TU22_9BURK|nr:hypothetical protein [Pandoraea pneumonica]VVD91436.1 hypothetical protein PPN31114_01682 [Pandoraea pneumonica]